MERLVDRGLGAHLFGLDAPAEPLPQRARIVVIGGGIAGASTAYHLASLGETDVLVLERNLLGSGTTWHAAGLVSCVRATPALSELASYGVELYAGLEEESGLEVAFNQCGSISLARTDGRMDELRYAAALARRMGHPAELVDPAEVARLFPLADPADLVGGMYQPGDGHVNPGYAAVALAKLAHERGVLIYEGIAVTAIRQVGGHVTGVATSGGDVECERVVLAGGLWSRDLAATAGARLPVYAAEHVHVRTAPIDGAVATLPVLRDLDGYLYVRHEDGRLLVGAFEPDGIARRTDEIGADGFFEFPAAWDHFSPVRRLAEERVPALRTTDYERFLNAPESFTPDGTLCIGETAEVRGLFVIAGFNSQGIILSPGAGRATAEWIVNDAPTIDSAGVDVQRFAAIQSIERYLHGRTYEALGRLYAMHWPQLQPSTARNVRRTPLHDRLAAANACFGETVGWERANWFGTGTEPAAYDYSYGRQNWFEDTREEHAAARESVALFDLSSFTKVEVAGPDALTVLQRFCTADVDVAPGRVRYTLMLNPHGGIELDGTVVRLAENRFWVITAAAAQTKTLAMLRRLANDRPVAVFDATAGFATLAVMGPHSRELISRVSSADWSDAAQPFGTARTVEIADGEALAVRVSFVGELGYELYPSADLAVNVYDAIIDAGRELGLRHAGYHALDSLRSEKGYRHLGHDIGPDNDPFDSGLGFTVSWDKIEPFTGREASVRRREAPSRRLVHVALDDPAGLFVHDETILLDGTPVGYLTSGAYGYTLGRAVGIGYVQADAPDDGAYEVDCGGELLAATLSRKPFYDPTNSRLRG